MTYLKCKSCGHYNELKSEFLTFCAECGKKLSPNYADWKLKNPEGTFEQFQHETGIKPKKARTNHLGLLQQRYLAWAGRRGVIITIILVIGLAAVAGGYIGKKVVFNLIYPKINKAWLYSSWETVKIGRQTIEISTPMHLGVNDRPLAPEIAQFVEYAKSYRNRVEEGMQVEVNMYSYRPNVSNDLEVAGAAAATEMKKNQEISDLQYKTDTLTQNGMSALLQEGSFIYKNGIRLAFSNLLMVNGQHRWEIVIRYREDDTLALATAHRIIKSIDVK
ncbi:hypothetical protein [Chitinophaga pinensis]|uniref:Uncharacterized protein n=1 Tax=Chitinophaga pinensis (strain ATCC 43595 / DSM 2588 / LMG 13176 / NBRC 15968 / NCIMB 11800 / UQM 2034) TaxID=485918 RepID=A0A979G1L6_CHIPD|nr:hypothetical protein [Chitinophaga pinensis]ACU59140.1 hypothetical protein Cpin_1644 [Chitinophaga pinensis DSM 2588]